MFFFFWDLPVLSAVSVPVEEVKLCTRLLMPAMWCSGINGGEYDFSKKKSEISVKCVTKKNVCTFWHCALHTFFILG